MKTSMLLVLLLACTTAPTLDRARQSAVGTGLSAPRRSNGVLDQVPEIDHWLPPSGRTSRRATSLAVSTGALVPSPDCKFSDDQMSPIAVANLAKAQSWLVSIKSKGYDPKIVAEYESSLRCGGQIVFGWLEEIRLTNDPSINPLEWMCGHGYNSPLWYTSYTVEGDRPTSKILYEVVVQINDRKFVVPVNNDTGQTHWSFRVFAPCEITWFKGVVLWHTKSLQ